MQEDPRAVPDNVARQVRALRVDRGWSQDELARQVDALGISLGGSTGVTRLEKGERAVRVDELYAIAAAFGVPVLLLTEPQAPTVRSGLLRAERERDAAAKAVKDRVRDYELAKDQYDRAELQVGAFEALTAYLLDPNDSTLEAAAYAVALRTPFEPPLTEEWLRLAGLDHNRITAAIKATSRPRPPKDNETYARRFARALLRTDGGSDGKHQTPE